MNKYWESVWKQIPFVWWETITKSHVKQYGAKREAARGDGSDLIVLPTYIAAVDTICSDLQHLSQSLDASVDEYYTIAANWKTDIKEILQGETWVPMALRSWR